MSTSLRKQLAALDVQIANAPTDYAESVLNESRRKLVAKLKSPKPAKVKLTKKETRTLLAEIIDGMTKLEVEMAQHSHYVGDANEKTVASWVLKSSHLSSRLDKVWKQI